MTRWDRRPWTNWLGDIVVPRPERHYYPRTCADLIDIVHDAEARTPPAKVRASGSHWALSDAAVSPNWFVETAALDRTLTRILPDALSRAARDELAKQPAGHHRSYCHVEAGITISALSERLDAGPGPRWALPTMGGAAAMTLAGAISTGTHGGDHELPPMADFVRALHLVTTGGRQLWIEPDNGITDPTELARLLPDVEQVRSTETFQAALVAVGRIGIIYSVVIEVVEQFSLTQVISKSTWEDQRELARAPYNVFQASPPDAMDPSGLRPHFVEIVIQLYSEGGRGHTCYVTHRWIGPDGQRPPPPRQDLFARVCSHRTLRPVVLVLVGGVALLLIATAVLGGPKRLIKADGALLVLLAALLPVSWHATVGGLIAGLCNRANRHGLSSLVRVLGERVLGAFRPQAVVKDVGYHVMDLGRTSGNCYRGDGIEALFDADSGEHVQFVDKDLFPLLDDYAARRMALAGYISLRFTRASTALLAMQRWNRTCSVEVAFLKDLDGSLAVLDALQAAAVHRGGTVHWGERNTLSANPGSS